MKDTKINIVSRGKVIDITSRYAGNVKLVTSNIALLKEAKKDDFYGVYFDDDKNLNITNKSYKLLVRELVKELEIKDSYELNR